MAGTATFGGDPSASPKDRVRALVGDIKSPFLLADSIIAGTLAATGGVYSAAADICRGLALLYASDVDVALSGIVSENGSQRSARYAQMAERFDVLAFKAGETAVLGGAATELGMPVIKGVSVSELEAAACDSDRPRPAFRSSRTSLFDHDGRWR